MRTSLATGIAAALIVTVLGGFVGWYAYLRTHTSQIQAADTARGFSSGSSFLGLGGSTPSPDTTEGPAAATSATPTFLGSTLLGAILGRAPLEEGTTTQVATTTPAKTPRLWHATKTPVAGFGFVVGDNLRIQYVERATGYIFETDPWTGQTERLTNTLNPKTQEALFAKNAIIERSLGETGVITKTGVVGRNATSSAYISTALETTILRIASDATLPTILYVRRAAVGTEIISANADGTKPKVLFTSPLIGWNAIQVPGHTTIVQLSSDGVPGSAYDIRKDGSLSTLVSNLPGLMILPRASSTALLWSTADGRSVSLFARASESASAIPLSLKTIAEKCVWAPQTASTLFAYCAVPRTLAQGPFLDPWHQGALFTDDAWWQVDVSAGATQALYADESGIDVRSPQIDSSGRFIAFINGRDSSLWVLRVVQ